MKEIEIETLATIYSHELSFYKKMLVKLRKELKELLESIPDEVRLRLRELGHYDVVRLKMILNRKRKPEDEPSLPDQEE